MAILSKGCKPDNFESHNSLKLSFADIRILLNVNLSLKQTLLAFLLCARLVSIDSRDVSIDSGSFSVTGYLPLIRKDSITHMYGLALM